MSLPAVCALQALGAAGSVLACVGPLMGLAAQAGMPLFSTLSQLKSILLGAAAQLPAAFAAPGLGPKPSMPEGEEAREEGARWPSEGVQAGVDKGCWEWQEPLGGTAGAKYALRGAGGSAAVRATLVIAEQLGMGLVAAWKAGQQPLVHALLLPPDASTSQPSDIKVGCTGQIRSVFVSLS